MVELRAPITGILIGRIEERRSCSGNFDIRSILSGHIMIVDPNEYPRRFGYRQSDGMITAIERRRSVISQSDSISP